METVFHDPNSLIQVNWEEEFRKAVLERDNARREICETTSTKSYAISGEYLKGNINYYKTIRNNYAKSRGWSYLYINEEEKNA